jgi:hypothetical protein
MANLINGLGGSLPAPAECASIDKNQAVGAGVSEEVERGGIGLEGNGAGVDPTAVALALAKFAEAEKYAPNWGRLHLKWGEAPYYIGRKDEARDQFARAAQLDLAPAEKVELAMNSPAIEAGDKK